MMTFSILLMALSSFITRFGPFTTVTFVTKDMNDNHFLNLTQNVFGLLQVVTAQAPDQGYLEDNRDLVICFDKCQSGPVGTWVVPHGSLEPSRLTLDSDVFTYEFSEVGSVTFKEIYGLKNMMGFEHVVGKWNASAHCKYNSACKKFDVYLKFLFRVYRAQQI